MKKETQQNIIGTSFLVICMLLFGLWYTGKEKANYLTHGKFTKGVLISYKYKPNARLAMTYKYEVDGKVYRKEQSFIEFPQGAERHFLNRTFSVVYIDNEPQESRILCSKGDFDFLGIKYPDSLQWTRQLEF